MIRCVIFFFNDVAELAINNENNCNIVFEVSDVFKAKLMLNRAVSEISQFGSNIVHGTTKCGELHDIHSGKILSSI